MPPRRLSLPHPAASSRQTAGHLCLVAVKNGATAVTLAARRPIVRKPFDVDLQARVTSPPPRIQLPLALPPLCSARLLAAASAALRPCRRWLATGEARPSLPSGQLPRATGRASSAG